MTKQAKSCMDCGWARWQRTPTGRISKILYGLCVWSFPKITIPKSFDGLIDTDSFYSPAIWTDSLHTDCPTWKGEAMKRDKWISAKNKMPVSDKRCFVCIENTNTEFRDVVYGYWDVYRWTDGEQAADEQVGVMGSVEEGNWKVTHWQYAPPDKFPLPPEGT